VGEEEGRVEGYKLGDAVGLPVGGVVGAPVGAARRIETIGQSAE
jgi:hypothetical protein